MVLDIVIRGRFKFVAVKVLHDASLHPRTNRLLARRSARKYLHVYDIVLLCSRFCIVVLAAVKYQVTGTQLIESEVNGQRVVLIRLIPHT